MYRISITMLHLECLITPHFIVEETSLRSDSNRKLARERGNDAALQAAESTASLQEEEEPIEYKNVTIKRDTFNNVYDKLDELGKGRFGIVFEVKKRS